MLLLCSNLRQKFIVNSSKFPFSEDTRPATDSEDIDFPVAGDVSGPAHRKSMRSPKSLRLAHGPWRYIDAPPESVCDLAILATHKAATAGILLLWVAILN